MDYESLMASPAVTIEEKEELMEIIEKNCKIK